MKKILLIVMAIYYTCSANASNYDLSVPLKGDSVASDILQEKVLQSLYTNIFKLNPSCDKFTVSDTQVVQYPSDIIKKKNRYIKGYWKELWTVDYCGEKVQVPITFKINKKTTTFEIDNNFTM